jgi:hypothetical protein
MGYQGDMGQFQQYIEQDPARQQQMNMYTNAAQKMAQGGMVKKYAHGGYHAPGTPGGPAAPVQLQSAGSGATPVQPNLQGIPQQAALPTQTPAQTAQLLYPSQGTAARGPYVPQTPIQNPNNTSGQGLANLGNFMPQTNYQALIAQSNAAAIANPILQQRQTPTQTPAQIAAAQAAQQQQQQQINANMAASFAGQPIPFPGVTAQQTFASQASTPQAQGGGIGTGGLLPSNLGPIPGIGIHLPPTSNRGNTINPSGTQAPTPTVTGPSMNTVANPYTKNPTTGQIKAYPAVQPQPGMMFAYDKDDERIEVPVGYDFTKTTQRPQNVGEFSVDQVYNPGVPVGGTTIAAQTQQTAGQDLTQGTGTLTGAVAVPTATAAASQAPTITPSATNIMQASQAAPAVDAAMQATQAAQANPADPRAQVTAAQQTASSVGSLSAAQGNASLINSPVQRQIQTGELISGVADAATAAQFTEQIQAAQTTPTQAAMVQGQLDSLMQQFVGGNTPAWAAGAIRNANAAMSARGLGASSLAGQAIVQAAMESALPIAQADAQIQAQFEGQNLSNRQQIAMLSAQQRAKFMGQEFDQAFQSRVQNSARIGDIANMNFTAEQQVQLENSRATNTMNLNNLSNSQAMVMAEASALAQLDTQNLNNRQQSAVQNANSFLQTDMANLSNQQQTDLFKAQQRVQSLFTDQAATNAAAQFNASSQNQTDQFFQNLGAQVSQFNATQQNAQGQFNAGQANTVNRFNAELNNQRDQFNAQNQLVIAQSNAQWRRQIATADTAAVNRANELNANAILDISKQAYNNLWNYYGDTMEWAWTSAESQLDRISAMAIAELDAKTKSEASDAAGKSAAGSAIGSLIGTLGTAWIMCWVAREVYGKSNPEWFIFRTWLEYDAPKWFRKLYVTHGENYAKLIAKVPPLKWLTKQLMDMVVENKRRKHNVQTV